MSPANTAARDAWNGEEGRRWVARADRRDEVLAPIAELLAEAAAVRPGEAVVDVGCGCGTTTFAASEATGPDGEVVGVDISAPMLEVARRRARGRDRVSFRQADAQTDRLGGPFDLAISRFGTMFFDDPRAAFANLARHLADGARLCLLTWQPLDANPWLTVPCGVLVDHSPLAGLPEPEGPGMFSQSDPSVVAAVLGATGFGRVSSEAHTVRLRVGADADEAADHLADTGLARAILASMPPDHRAGARVGLRAALDAHADPSGGVVLDAAVWVTRATRGASRSWGADPPPPAPEVPLAISRPTRPRFETDAGEA